MHQKWQLNIVMDMKGENNSNLNLLKPQYFQKKTELSDILEKYNRLYD